MAENIKALERENRELRQSEEDQKTIRGIVFPTNEILRKASAYFTMAPLGECGIRLPGNGSSTADTRHDRLH